uniref:PAX-interacting protein 1 n=1 Tax=Caenorhabditis tropicalis TaxID=1561998 RepID=A0A1I7TDI7_9PELO
MSDSMETDEVVSQRPESPPLGLLDPSRIQNPLAVDQTQQMPQQTSNESGFVMPEQPRQQLPQQNWQRTPTMSPANIYQPGSGPPSSQRSSTGTPNHQMGPQQQFFESPIHSQGAPMTPQSAGPPGSNCGTPQSAGPPSSAPVPYDYQAAQMQQQQHAQAMAAAAAQQQQQYGNQNPQQMHDSPYRMMGMHQHPGHPSQYPPGYPPPQWQQQMYARQAAAAAQQRAAAQRVPYPPSAYPPGMSGPPGPMTPVYPPQTPTGQRTTPGSAGPGTGPPGTPQRPQYPQGTNPQPQPQFAYPPTQQMTPTGQPPGYPIPGTPTFPSPAHQMYRQGPPTAPPGIRQYISPQGGQQQPTPGTPHRFPSQPTPGATASPHFAPAPGAIGADLRSPSLMSPNQHPSQQHTPVLPRALHNDVAPQAMRPMALPSQAIPQPQVTPQTPLSSTSLPPQSAGSNQFVYRPGPPGHMHHDPNAFPPPIISDPELFLSGMLIHCFDPDKLFEDKLDRQTLEFMIKYHGGEIEFEPSKFAEKVHQISHVLVDSCRNINVRQSLEQRKRIISMQWLVDVFQRQKGDIPWKLAHLPAPFNENFRPYLGKLFSLSGFDESERGAISFMAEAMGAKITPFLAKQNDLLIAKAPAEKVTKAVEWKIPVVNYQWIADAYVCGSAQPHERPNVENPRYQLGQNCHEVNSSPAVIEMFSNEFAAMISSIEEKDRRWKEHLEKIGQNRLHKDFYQIPEPDPKVIVWFGDAIDEETLGILKKKVEFLGGKYTEKIQKATHVVVMSGRRSLHLLEAIIRGKNIVDPEWIVDSYIQRTWRDTFDYFLHDKALEKELAYNCKRSVLRARHKPVFEDIEFHITKFVEPCQKDLVRLIELGGGKVHEDKPDPKYLARCIETEQPYIIISCENDARFLSYLAETKLPIYNVDLCLFAMLRQVIEPLPQYRIPIPIVVKAPVFRQPPPYTAQTPASAIKEKVSTTPVPSTETHLDKNS